MAQKSEYQWISFSDMMTGLMIIFMFIAISYIMEKERQRNKIFIEFKNTKDDLYNDLDSTFKRDFEKWEVILDKDLSIKFVNPDFLFDSGEATIKDDFKEILDDFLPRYFSIILQDKYIDNISEIRIEGHTDTVPDPRRDPDPYIANIKLSQERSAAILKYFRNMNYYKTDLSKSQEQQLQFLLTANGLSFGKTLDNNRDLTFFSDSPINKEFSRRVEFRIVTTSEKLVEKVLTDLQNGTI